MSLVPLKHEGRLSASVSGVWDQNVLLDLGWLRSVYLQALEISLRVRGDAACP